MRELVERMTISAVGALAHAHLVFKRRTSRVGYI